MIRATNSHPAVVRAHADATRAVLDAHLGKCMICRTATPGHKKPCPQGAAAFDEWVIADYRLRNGENK